MQPFCPATILLSNSALPSLAHLACPCKRTPPLRWTGQDGPSALGPFPIPRQLPQPQPGRGSKLTWEKFSHRNRSPWGSPYLPPAKYTAGARPRAALRISLRWLPQSPRRPHHKSPLPSSRGQKSSFSQPGQLPQGPRGGLWGARLHLTLPKMQSPLLQGERMLAHRLATRRGEKSCSAAGPRAHNLASGTWLAQDVSPRHHPDRATLFLLL